MMRTVAPLVMAASASESSVASLPCAFCTENCVGVRPAAASASLRYGASNSVYRAEETVSGRIAATFPWPIAASGFSVLMEVKVLLRSLIEIVGTEAAELELAVEPLAGFAVELLLLHAAAARHKARDSVSAAPLLPFRVIKNHLAS